MFKQCISGLTRDDTCNTYNTSTSGLSIIANRHSMQSNVFQAINVLRMSACGKDEQQS
jgi:hypothetical protein